MVLRDKFALVNVTTPFEMAVKTKPVEKGEFDRSYAKILRKVIESVSYVRLEETKLILKKQKKRYERIRLTQVNRSYKNSNHLRLPYFLDLV